MAALKTQPTDEDVTAFLNSIEDERKRADALATCALMGEVTGEPPRMWGKNMVGFGSYDYLYASGKSGTWFLAGFSPRKTSLTLYVMSGFAGADDLMARLGKHKTGKSCLYLKRLSDVDEEVLRKLVAGSVATMKERYPAS